MSELPSVVAITTEALEKKYVSRMLFDEVAAERDAMGVAIDNLKNALQKLEVERDAALARVRYLEAAMGVLAEPPGKAPEGMFYWVKAENVNDFAAAALAGTWKPE